MVWYRMQMAHRTPIPITTYPVPLPSLVFICITPLQDLKFTQKLCLLSVFILLHSALNCQLRMKGGCLWQNLFPSYWRLAETAPSGFPGEHEQGIALPPNAA